MRQQRKGSIENKQKRGSSTRLGADGLVVAFLSLSALLAWLNLRVVVVNNNKVPSSFPINMESVASAATVASPPQLGQRNDDDHVPSAKGGAAACLLVMDDNHLLIEWLAFHYHSLPLRYLVLAVDPRSKTRPDKILKRWTTTRNNSANNLTIVQWDHDTDYMTQAELALAEQHVRRYFGSTLAPELIRHRARQRMFYFKCMQHVKKQGRHWTALIDTDEYLALNYDTLQRLHGRGQDDIPSIGQPGSVLQFIQDELKRLDAFQNITTPCIQIPRIRFGAKESPTNVIGQNVPPSFTASSFSTLRWRWHTTQDNYNLNRISKTIIDVSRVPWDALQPIDSIHRPIKSLCGHRKLHIRKSEQALVIHHYLGTHEQYFFRDDARQGKERSEKEYRKMRNIDAENDDVLRPWLQGFVDTMGYQVAKELTEGAGKLD